MPAIHFVSLGCPKNRVDTEVMIGVAEQQGWQLTADAVEAEAIVVNTCGFIGPAAKESVDTILELAELKQRGRCRLLVVSGCLAQGHPAELERELPEVDFFLGSSDAPKLGRVLAGRGGRLQVGRPGEWLMTSDAPRRLSTHAGSAYLKIAEGCNRHCAFCIIPALRGRQRSRPAEDLLREVRWLTAQGVKEINLIAQDSMAYGRDLDLPGAEEPLAELVQAVADTAGVHWVRIFYLYPERLGPALLELLAQHPGVLPYVDMPLQHASARMLRLMRRGHDPLQLRRLIDRLRGDIDDLTLRSAFIVGHPGETDADFAELYALVEWAAPEHLGVFRYSDEPTSHSHSLADKVPPLVAANRWRRLMALGRRIAQRKNSALMGRALEVLVEGTSDEHELVVMGRHRGQAPEIDGQVYLSGTERLAAPPKPGAMVRVTVSQCSDYDLVGEVGEDTSDAAEPPRAPSNGCRRLPVVGGHSWRES